MILLNNGLDSLRKAVKELKNIPVIQDSDEKESTMKDVIIHLHHSIETLFKYIIQNVNPYLIIDDIKGAFNYQFDNLLNNKSQDKDEKTIEFLDAVHRVFILKRNEQNIKIDQQHYNLFESLNRVRNALTHYKYEFDYDFEEHKIAGILQILVPLYDECLPNFYSFAERCGLYEDVQSLRSNGLYWETRQSMAIYLKIKNAIVKKSNLDKNPKEYTKLFNTRNKKLIYSNCPVCGKDLFVKSSNYIVDSEHIHELGKCFCCEFEYTQEDAQLVTYKYNNMQELQNKLDSKTLVQLIKQQLIDSGDGAYKCTPNELSVIESELYNNLSILTDNLCEHVACQYVGRVITQYNDYAEAIYKLEDITDFCDEEDYEPADDDEFIDASHIAYSKYIDEYSDDHATVFDGYSENTVNCKSRETRHQWINLEEEIKMHGFPPNGEYYWRLEKLMLDYITKIDISISRRIKRKLSKTDYLVYCDSMFMNGEGQDVYFDVPVTVNFKSSKFQKLTFPVEC
jgi:hypothetical protein